MKAWQSVQDRVGHRGFEAQEKPSFCFLEEDPGICRGMISKYFYNKESQLCEKFMYGGCLGNQNNFDFLKECQDICEDSPNSCNRKKRRPFLVSTTVPRCKAG
uniref:Uncharacterized protein n=1 Tax=Sphaerodactylus townsendi TaxID=933632 RepID=A0ACB8EA03_9SAUR